MLTVTIAFYYIKWAVNKFYEVETGIKRKLINKL